jgi:hypothetical protein
VVVVHHLDEWLDFRPLLDSLLAHAAGDFGRISLDACDQGVGEGVLFCAGVDWLDEDALNRFVSMPYRLSMGCHYLLAGIAATGDDGNTANLEELHFGPFLGLLWYDNRVLRWC